MPPNSEAKIAIPNVAVQSRSDRRLMGKKMRDTVPRSKQATWKPYANRLTVQDLLIESNKDRLSNLIAIRHGRMKDSPLAFFRGLALSMAKDLANTPNSGILLPICGDCHLQNLGWFATPERNLVFDLTDFDETTTGCWEWDVKRLVTSFVLAARELGLGHLHQKEVAHQVARAYRENIGVYEAIEPLQMWYQRIDAKSVLAHVKLPDSQARMEKSIAAARSRTVEALLPKITRVDLRNPVKRGFADHPPILSHQHDSEGFLAETESMIGAYVQTLSDGRSELFQRYSLSDAAMKVVGVGSVGLRCGILLFEDPDGAPLVLQIKE